MIEVVTFVVIEILPLKVVVDYLKIEDENDKHFDLYLIVKGLVVIVIEKVVGEVVYEIIVDNRISKRSKDAINQKSNNKGE